MTSVPSVTARDLLEALPEPILVLHTDGNVVMANGAASARFGPLAGQNLVGLAPPPGTAGLRAYLGRCSGSRGPLPGTTTLRGADGADARLRCSGNLLAPARDGASALVLLKLSEAGDERFSALARDVRQLNAEIRERRRTQAVLEEALRDRDIMLRELHHRVKNNIQTLAGMLAVAKSEADAPEARAVLAEVARRLGAIGAVHQMLYRTENIESLDGARFTADLSAGILRPYAAEGRLSARGVAGLTIPNDAAIPLALILNELVVNAVKHGPSDGEIRVDLARAGDVFELSVGDDGPGFDFAEPAKRASGLGLVRGLARQLGGSVVVERGERGERRGARCIVRFVVRGADRAGQAAVR